MSELVDMLVRGGLLLAAASIGSVALRGRSPALVSCYWRFALVAVLLVPIVPTVWRLQQTVPEIPISVVVELPATVAVPMAEERTEPLEAQRVAEIFEPAIVLAPSAELSTVDEPAAIVAKTSSFAWLGVLIIAVWGIGALVIFGRWIVAALRFRRLWRRAVPAGDSELVGQFRELAQGLGLRRAPSLMTHSEIAVPMAGGVLRSRVLLPNDCALWNEEDRRMVLMHELVHVKRRDALFHLLASLAKSLHWVNPLAWLAVRSMREAAERATDDRVLEDGVGGSNYARLLVEFAGRQMATASPLAPAAASSMAKPDTVESRVRRILDLGQRRQRPGVLVSMFLACGFAGLLALVGGTVFAQADTTEQDKADAKAIASMSQSLDEIIVPEVHFEEATLREAVDFCLKKSREADPDGRGVNMIVIGDVGNAQNPAPLLNLKLRNIPMGELLRYVAMLSWTELDIEPHSVVFRPNFSHSRQLHSKAYSLSSALFEQAAVRMGGNGGGGDPFGMDDPFGGGGGGGGEPAVSPIPSARGWLAGAGVMFPDGASAHFEPLSAQLIVRNTQGELDLVEELLDSMKGIKPAAARSSDALAERLRSTVIPFLDFEDASLAEAIDFLGTQAGDEPINLIQLGGGMVFDGEQPKPLTISLRLRDIPFETALSYITESINHVYRIEPHAVVILPFNSDGGELVVRTLPIPNTELQSRFSASPYAARNWLMNVGVPFSDGTSVYFDAIGNNLVLRVQKFAITLVENALANIPERSDPPAAAIVEPDPAPLGLPKLETERKAVPRVVVGFFEAETVDERLRYVRDRERVRPLMESWYKDSQPEIIFGERQNIPINILHIKRIEDQGRNFIIVAMTVASSAPKLYALEETENGLKLDWETAVGYQPIPIDRFKEETPKEPVEFRVKLKPSDFYNHGFSDSEKYRAVELSYPGRPEFNLIGYIDRGTDWGAKLSESLDVGIAPSLIVELKYPEGEIKDRSQVEIVKIVAETWWLSDTSEK